MPPCSTRIFSCAAWKSARVARPSPSVSTWRNISAAWARNSSSVTLPSLLASSRANGPPPGWARAETAPVAASTAAPARILKVRVIERNSWMDAGGGADGKLGASCHRRFAGGDLYCRKMSRPRSQGRWRGLIPSCIAKSFDSRGKGGRMASRTRPVLDEAAEPPAWLGSTALLDQVPDGLILADEEGRIVFVNAAAERLHGVRRLGVAPDGYAEAYSLFTLDGLPYPAEQLPLARAVAGETVIDARWRIRRPDGGEIVAIGPARPFLDEAGRRRGAILTLRDDSARHAAELALAESEARFRTIADVAPAPVWVTGPRGIEFANRAYAEIAERPVEALLGHKWIGMIHTDDIPAILALRDESWREKKPYGYQARFQRASGEWRWIEVSCAPRFDAAGEVAGYVGMAVDITERRRAEESLKGSEALLRAMFDHAGVGMVLMDRDCIIADANAAFAGITGRARDEMIGACCLGFTHPDDPPANRAALASLEAGGDPVAFEKRYVRQDETVIWVRITLSLVGEQVLGMVEDVTARKTAELHLGL